MNIRCLRSLFVIALSIVVAAPAVFACPTPSLTHLTPVTSTNDNPLGFVFADFNNDNKLDMVSTSSIGGSVQVRRGNGDGTFQSGITYVIGTDTTSVAAGDFNNDGYLDIIAGNYDAASVGVLINKKDGTFNSVLVAASIAHPHGIYTADFDGDGNLDALIIGDNLAIMYGAGNGTFSSTSTLPTTSLSTARIADIDHDGKPDIALLYNNFIQQNMHYTTLLNRGAQFVNGSDHIVEAVMDNDSSMAVADFNGDGLLDIAAMRSSEKKIRILIGNGDGTFVLGADVAAGTNPSDVAAGDVNEDGNVDIAIASDSGSQMTILLGSGNGQFTSTTVSFGSIHYFARIAVTDLDGDGRNDVALLDSFANFADFYMNNCTPRYAPVTIVSQDNPSTYPYTVVIDAFVTPRASGLAAPTGSLIIDVDGANYVNGWPLTPGASSSSANISLNPLLPGNHTIDITYTGDANYTTSKAKTFTQVVNRAPFSTPQNFVATRGSSGMANLSWVASLGVHHFELAYKSNGSWIAIGNVSGSVEAITVAFNRSTEIFAVRAVSPGGSMTSYAADVASDIAFTSAATGQLIRASQLNELRTAAAAFRTDAGLSAFPFTDTITVGTVIKAIHISQLRTAINEARSSIGQFGAIYLNDPINPGASIMSIDLTEMQDVLR